MACNSRDEKEISFPVFDEKVEMKNPKFELGMMFATFKIFRKVVKKHAVLERRPIKQCRNYGSRVKFFVKNLVSGIFMLPKSRCQIHIK